MSARGFIVHDAVLLDADGRREGWFRTEGPAIVDIGSGDDWRALRYDGMRAIDARGANVTPGFIDLHGHGAAGVSYDDDVSPLAALDHHRRHGTTRSVLSVVSGSAQNQARALQRIAQLADQDPLVLGSHLEGPFLSPARRGAHDPAVLTDPAVDLVSRQVDAARGTLRMVTIAPERPGSEDAQDVYQAHDVVVALGHTEADYATALAAFGRGARALTHAFNAMPPVLHRAPGPVMAAVDAGAVLELIADGVHVHDSLSAGLFRLAPGRVALVTDAMAATGCVDGDYRLGALDVELRGGVARLAGTDTLAGSTLTQDAALRRAVEDLRIDPVVAVAALTLVPATLLGRRDLGRLAVGARADFLVLGDDWSPRLVVAEGSVVSDRRDPSLA
ncbi:N-acetylglucosamine 6-phosphate deacetylase [Microbacterium sp. AG1240]|nr:N-acetylglucosamine 6-phosphate deacetylase [Microbacterium sp. AG1240]